MGNVDISGKQTLNIYNQAWAKWVLQSEQIEVEAELSGEFQFIARATDSLLQVRSNVGRFLALTELQFRYDKNMPERLAAYKLLARQRYALPVFATVIYFLPPPTDVKLAMVYDDEFMGQRSQVDFQVVKLWDLEAEQVLAFDNPALLPFVPLMSGGNTAQMVRRCVERIRQEPQALELETILSVFAGYVMDTNLIKQMLRWEMDIVKQSPIIQELLTHEHQLGFAEGHEKGREEGREEGERKAALEALRQTLTIRFNVVLGEFDKRIEQHNLRSLKQLNEVALTAQTLPDFEKALAEMLAKLETK